MTDEAKLVLAVDATQPKQAATTLDELAAAGARAEASTDKLNKAAKSGADSTMAFQKAWFDGKNTIDNSTLSIIRASDETQKLIDRYDPLGAKLRNLEKDFKALSDAARTGLIPDSANGSVDQAYVRINSEIAKTKTLMGEVGDAGAKGFKAAEEAANKSMFATVSAKRELIVLAHEAMTGNFSRMPGSMLVLAEYTHFTSTMFNALTLSVAGVTVGLVATFAAMIKGAHEQKGFNDALIMSGNYAGATGDKLNEMAHKATAAGGSLNTAKESVEGLAASGKYTSDQIQAIASSVVLMEAAVEKSTQKTIKQFESLAVESTGHTSLAADVISRAVVKLDDEYHFLTLSVYNNIRALELEGQQKEASALATNEFAKATHDRAKDIMDNLGDVAKAWNAVKESVNGAIDAVGNVGKRRTAASDVATAQANIGALSGTDDQYGLTVGMAGKDRMMAEAKEALIDATKRLIRENDNALVQGEQAKVQSAAIHAAQQLDLQMKSLQKKSQGELTTAMQEYHQRIEVIRAADANDSRVSAQAIIDGEAAITRAYAEKTKAGVDSYGAISASIARAREQVELSLDQDGKLAASDRFRISTLNEIDEALRKGTITMQRANELSKEMQDTQGLMRNREKLIQQLKDEADAVKELETNINALYKAGMKDVEATEKQISKLEAHNSEIGKSKEQINQIRAARQEQSAVDDEVYAGLLREAALFAGDYHDAYLGYAKDLETIAANKRKIAQLDRDGALLEKGASLAKEQAAEWAKNWKEINKLGQDVFVEWGMSGENMAKKIGDMLKKALLSAIYDATLKPLVFQMYSSVMGGPPDGTRGVQGLMGQGSSMVNTASNLNTLYGAGAQYLYGGTAGASNASLLYANGVQATGGDGLGALIQGNGGWAGVNTGVASSGLSGVGATAGGTEVGGSLGIGSGTTLGGAEATGSSWAGVGSSALAFLPLLFAAWGASKDAFRVSSTGDSSSQFDANGRVINRSNQFFGGEHPISIPTIVNGVAVSDQKKPSDYTTNDLPLIDGHTQAQLDATYATNSAIGDAHFTTINSAADKYTETLNAAYLAAIKNLGGTAVSTNFTFGSNDTRNGAGGGARIGASAGNRTFDSGEITVSDADLTLAASRAILTALAGSDLPAYMQGVFDNVDASQLDQEGIDSAIAAAGKLKSAYETLSLIPNIDISTLSHELVDSLKNDAQALATVNIAASRFGYTMLSVSAQGGAAAQDLISAFGNLQNFQTQTAQFFQNFFTADEQASATYAQVQSDLHKVGIDYTIDQLRAATVSDIRAAADYYHSGVGTTQGDAQFAAIITAGNALAPLVNASTHLATAANTATSAIGGSGGGGGGGSSADTLVGALQGLTDAIFEEVNRIKGLIAGDSMLGYAEAQAKFALGTAMARAGDQEAIKALPGLSQNMLRLAEINEASLVDLNYVRATTANSLQVTGTQLANQNGLSIPQFASGTDYVPQDMLAMIHEGERITPKGFNPTANETGNTEMLQVLWTIRGDMKDAVALLQSIDRNMKRSADIIEKSDTIGPAPARAVA